MSVLLALALAGGGAVVLAAPAAAVPTGGFLVYGLTATDQITSFRTAAPATRTAPVAITGLTAGDDVVGIDIRPATGQLYGIVKGSAADRVITIDPATGAATVIGAPISPRLSGTSFGVDFNPVPDRIRVISDADQNLRLNPVTGGASAVTAPSTTGDGTLAYATGDAGTGTDPVATAAGYTDSVAGTTMTTLYDIETARDVLVTQAPPNNGTLNTVGTGLGIGDVVAAAGFDIAAPGNEAFAALTVAGTTNLYSVNLTTGAATVVAGGLGTVDDITVAVPRVTIAATGLTEGGSATVTVTRSGDTSTAATVTYTTGSGSATSDTDFAATSGTLSFAAGEGAKTFSVPLTQDNLVEGAETFTVTLGTSTADHVLSPAVSTFTITDDETGRAYGLTTANEITTFSVQAPGTATLTRAITGLAAGDDVVGIDVRPATGELFGIVKGTASDRIVTIDPATGTATVVGAPISPRLSGTAFGVDFNPVPDRIRVVSDADQNLRLNPVTGGASTVTAPSTTGDVDLQYAAGDANAGQNPGVVGTGYTNSVAGATTTTLYDLDATGDRLVTQNPPNNGTLNTVGPLGVDIQNGSDLDISPAGGTAFAALTVGGVPALYRVNLTSGAATSLGALSPATTEDLALASPGRLAVSAETATVAESVGTATVTVTRSTPNGTVTVDYATGGGTATAGSDYTATSGTLTFADGEASKTISVPVTNDTADEPAETFVVTLTNPTGGASLGATTAQTVTITDDDGAITSLTLATAGPRAARGAPARISGTLSGPSGGLGGKTVELVARQQYTTRTAVVRTYTTAADGSFGGEVVPTVNTVLFARYAGSTTDDLAGSQSPQVLQVVRTSINAKAALNELDGPIATARISGDTAPAKPGSIVRLQRVVNGQLRSFDAAARVDSAGKWTLTRRLSRGTYVLRVTIGATHSNAAGTSNEVVVRVS
ncbi:MAG: DUF4394 domain-containing protein [Mycobacteriales bacterium]|nr:DUF4394 domain-containing protein [Mycobacteriales bacterium]